MDILKKLMNQLYSYQEQFHNYHDRRTFLSQAYGAVTLYMMEHPENEAEAIALWDEWKPRFEARMLEVHFQ